VGDRVHVRCRQPREERDEGADPQAHERNADHHRCGHADRHLGRHPPAVAFEAHESDHRHNHGHDHAGVAEITRADADPADHQHVRRHPRVHRDDHLGQVTGPARQVDVLWAGRRRWMGSPGRSVYLLSKHIPEPQSDYHRQREPQNIDARKRNGHRDPCDQGHRSREALPPPADLPKRHHLVRFRWADWFISIVRRPCAQRAGPFVTNRQVRCPLARQLLNSGRRGLI